MTNYICGFTFRPIQSVYAEHKKSGLGWDGSPFWEGRLLGVQSACAPRLQVGEYWKLPACDCGEIFLLDDLSVMQLVARGDVSECAHRYFLLTCDTAPHPGLRIKASEKQ